ncbi:piggyBac transposable element-derived protein 3 [Trichonephila clavipes]|nr:piggyBac transposable element-derived protein 3 [Trichonephila clavipes]
MFPEKIYTGAHTKIYVSIVSTVMPIRRFRKIFHSIDNTKLTSRDKMGTISPFYMPNLEKTIQQFGIFHSKLSRDESMVPYYCPYSAKIFIKGKPIMFRYKKWMLCCSSGYPYSMRIYSGNKLEIEISPLGSRVV